MKTTLRLMSTDCVTAELVQEFHIEEHPGTAGTILLHEDQHYIYSDAGNDERGPWEEWVPATVVAISVLTGAVP